jgi:uncharacterized protein YcfJ
MTHAPNPEFASERGTIGRRVFLGALAVGPIASVAPVAVVATATSETIQDRCKALYRDSPHVETFYRVNRYP